MLISDGKERFSKKAGVYHRARPSYPKEIVREVFKNINNTNMPPVVIDVGAGTGKFTSLLLEQGSIVYAVEPNKAMREQLTLAYGHNPNLHIITATAEKTTLPSAMADLIVAAHSFHWFDEYECKKEFSRILKNDGKVCLVWNWYAIKRESAMKEYYDLIRECATKEISRENKMKPDLFGIFFAQYETTSYPNDRYLDFQTVLQLAESANYSPVEGEQGYEIMRSRLQEWFDKHQKNNLVRFSCDSTMYKGIL
ncbi:class I SAM-dependent methyltransferase [Candidatus Bathycorpusculum sp.]|uniref:class I SAM-dependent methyltransferase n=1 Tax=Candidatus Bathycorpusculum sp. TaxID=2994959 RepID=UPI002838724C|nr:class I SAM-dependent methyltransferase [Candidatus Termitimicrobium sp.]MCL2684991.1 class I SAM-dependent methyltransferase [Candidatus Termitimicrobium sp.]